MNASREVITLETMAQCLADARTLLREGDMCADTYVSLLEDASQRIRSVLAFAQDNGLEIADGQETEAWKTADLFTLVDSFRRNISQDEDDLNWFLDHQSPSGVLVVEPGSRIVGKPTWLVYSYDLNKFVESGPLATHNWDAS